MTEKLFSQSRVSVISVIICALSVVICLFSLNKTASATSLKEVSYTVTVTATVGEPKLSIFGYTSPYANVRLEGIGVAKDTLAGENGYFEFNRVFLPSPTLRWVSGFKQALAYPELYLQAIDTDQRTSSPLTLPPLPTGPYEITVGPILLAPTITLQKGKFQPNEQVIANGQTIPDSQMTISLANQTLFSSKVNRWDFIFQFFRKLFRFLPFAYLSPVQAYANFLPKYQIQIREDGRFQFNLPANDVNTWRVFASTFYLNSPSAKSNTLTFEVMGVWRWFWEKVKQIFALLWGFIRPYFWQIGIVLEILLVILVITKLKRKKIDEAGTRVKFRFWGKSKPTIVIKI